MSKVIIIAEAGVNHNGDIVMAKKLIDAGVDAGVDYVKFQTFKADKLVSRDAKKADYQSKNIGDSDDSQYNMLKKLELSHEDHIELMAYCKERNIKFFSTAFDVDGVHYLNDLGLELFKVPSGEITNYPYLKAIASFNKPVILSTGMCTEQEIKDAVGVLTGAGLLKERISILHCNTEYPTPMKDVNLKAMLAISKEFDVEVGYSDHTLGIEVPIAAVAMGAVIIEKHFTLDRTLPGPDHVASLEPDELKQMVNAIRNIELAISGSGIKEPSASEMKNIAIARKSIHISRDLPMGHIITDDDIMALRPGDGISPMRWNAVVGKRLTADKKGFDKLLETDIA
ncbi:N-acetylneuraminate synthase [Flavobacterium suzhouense]|uniref:N-acetylneuraminate synthase n=1 Tax=Flavobacterium suzhouense TaxID=1529638 RepID=A0ABW5NQQ1_9FLAO